jgi:hypothetical protein
VDSPSIESVYYVGASPDVAWTGNTFDNWGETTSRLDPDAAGRLLLDNTLYPVAGPTVEVTGGTQAVDGLWSTEAGDYRVTGQVYVQGTDGPDGVTTLTIDPGVEVRFATGGQIQVGYSAPGALIADGDASGGPATITFTSDVVTPARGDWYGLWFRSQTDSSTLLRNAVVEYAGRDYYESFTHYTLGVAAFTPAGVPLVMEDVTIRETLGCAAQVWGGGLTLTDSVVTGTTGTGYCDGSGIYGGGTDVALTVTGSTFSQLGGSGIYATGTGATLAVSGSTFGQTTGISGSVVDSPSIESVYYVGASPDVAWTGNTFDNWGETTSRVSANDAGPLSRENDFNPVEGAVLEVLGGVISRDSIWTPNPGLFVGLGNLTVQGTDGGDLVTRLRLNPGVEVRFSNGNGLYVGGDSGDPGEFYADGRLGGGFTNPVRFGSANQVPAIGDWGGIVVRNTGWAALYEVDVRFATTALEARGTLGPVEHLMVNRAETGVYLNGGTLESTLEQPVLNNCDTAVRANGCPATIRNGDFYGISWGVLNDTPATVVDASYNWWGAEDGPSGEGSGHGCPVSTGVLYAPYQDQPHDDGDGVDPITDNCPTIANSSQRDLDGNGVGDACDLPPVLWVSSDPADDPDFDVVQDAADAPSRSGMTINVYPGSGPYAERVLLDRVQSFRIVGLDNEFEDPVIIDGGAAAAFDVTTAAGLPMRFENLTLWGNQGIRTDIDLDVEDMTFEFIAFEALDLDGGNHAVTRSEFRDTVAVGARVSEGASLGLSRSTMTGLTNAGLLVAGSADVENVLIVEGADGLRMEATGSADVRYCTIVNNTNYGIDNLHNGTVTVDRSIVYDNALDDFLTVGCDVVTWSDTRYPDCSFMDDNLSTNPRLEPDYTLQDNSPCIEHGPDPATYDGAPPTDLGGNPRLLDHDGDGMAVNDIGAFERENTALVPEQVLNVEWDNNFRMVWDAEFSAVEYHIYRDDLANLSYASFGVCRDDLDTNRTDLQLDDLEEPAPEAGFFYLVSAEDSLAEEGTLGYATGAERSNYGACP